MQSSGSAACTTRQCRAPGAHFPATTARQPQGSHGRTCAPASTGATIGPRRLRRNPPEAHLVKADALHTVLAALAHPHVCPPPVNGDEGGVVGGRVVPPRQQVPQRRCRGGGQGWVGGASGRLAARAARASRNRACAGRGMVGPCAPGRRMAPLYRTHRPGAHAQCGARACKPRPAPEKLSFSTCSTRLGLSSTMGSGCARLYSSTSTHCGAGREGPGHKGAVEEGRWALVPVTCHVVQRSRARRIGGHGAKRGRPGGPGPPRPGKPCGCTSNTCCSGRPREYEQGL